ncbi:MAG: DNA (cytosine-5-)-methyltransferase, partial [Promethearchaeota archaeon]
TYYGRLSSHLPSYTVNTYFNRPGNGTFIHPQQDRLISFREAARLQTFPDRYRFLGTLSSRYKQIGNAVPPLLAYAVARKFERGRVVDLFCGAGGLSEGFLQAGNHISFATDSNPHMCETYAYNHQETNVVAADINDISHVRMLSDEIENTLSGRTLTTLIGGPPCQGFSTAGRWNYSDSRNSLILKMLEFAQLLRPENVVIENVPGLKWMRNGRVLDLVSEKLKNEGYDVGVLDLRAEEYCVPQRRRRLFVVGNRNGMQVASPDKLLAPIAPGRSRKDARPKDNGLPAPVSVSEALFDLPPILSGGGEDRMEYDPRWTKTDYQHLMRGSLKLEDFIIKRTEQC